MDQATLSTIFILIGALAAGSFVIGLHFMNSPATGRNGNLISAGGMTVAVVTTFVYLLLRDEEGAESSSAASPCQPWSSSWPASSSVAPWA